MAVSKYEVWTDGSSTGGRGPGGWAFIVEDENKKVWWKSDGEEHTTNSRMEMVAVIEALDSLPEASLIELYCDSSMIVKGMREKWYEKWRSNAWLNSRNVPVVNRDLWEKLILVEQRHCNITYYKVKAHTNSNTKGARGNFSADSMAVRAKRRIIRQMEESS